MEVCLSHVLCEQTINVDEQIELAISFWRITYPQTQTLNDYIRSTVCLTLIASQINLCGDNIGCQGNESMPHPTQKTYKL